MFDYLQQFNSLPKDLRDKVSSPEAMSSLAEIESRYRVDLAMVVMKVMIKTLAVKDLPSLFISEFNLGPEQADKMSQELKAKIFAPVADYVGISSERRALDLSNDIGVLIKEAGMAMPSEFLIERLKSILATYLRGVRSKIDTKASLLKDIASGGLNLTQPEVDRILKVCDTEKFKSGENSSVVLKTPSPMTRLDKIVLGSEGLAQATEASSLSKPIVEYDLKRALASGETKRIAAPTEQATQPTVQPVEPPVAVEKKVSPVEPLLKAPLLEEKTAQSEFKNAGIVRKPENNGLLNKIFSDGSKPKLNSTPSGAVKLASISADAPIATVATQEAPKMKIANPAAARLAATGAMAADSSRKLMHDVKPLPKVMGPLEELQFLDLLNFRRLGKNPEEMTSKIFNKIKLLEREGYEKMIAGIGAWRKSPVSRLYLQIVQEAVASSLPLREAITAREKKGREGLSMEEIEAIMNLNSKLIF